MTDIDTRIYARYHLEVSWIAYFQPWCPSNKYVISYKNQHHSFQTLPWIFQKEFVHFLALVRWSLTNSPQCHPQWPRWFSQVLTQLHTFELIPQIDSSSPCLLCVSVLKILCQSILLLQSLELSCHPSLHRSQVLPHYLLRSEAKVSLHKWVIMQESEQKDFYMKD